jgi:hypothetical protein
MNYRTKDGQTGISIRFVQSWNPNELKIPSVTDCAIALACDDDREGVSTMDKIADALAFLKRYIH